MPRIELCSQTQDDIKNGRVPVKISAHEINDVPGASRANKNGIRYLEEYTLRNIDTAIGMPYVCSFVDENKSIPSDHGTLSHDENGNVIFENSEVVGSVTKAYIDTIEINGIEKTVLQTEGYLYYQRYPNLVKFLRGCRDHGEQIDVSVELDGRDGNPDIVYANGKYMPDGSLNMEREPQIFSYGAISLLYLCSPGDDCAKIVEINTKNNKEETNVEELNSIKEQLSAKTDELNIALTELNSVKDELNSSKAELNTLNASYASAKAELEALQAKEAELNELLVEANKNVEAQKVQLAELNTEIEPLRQMKSDIESEKAKTEINAYFETIKNEDGFSEAELNSLKEDYVDKCDMDGLKAREQELCVSKFKEMRGLEKAKAEINSKANDYDGLFFSTKIETKGIASDETDGSELFR